MRYKVRYGVLRPSELSNSILVLNKDYGDRIGEFGSKPITPYMPYKKMLEAKNGFYSKLEKSILEEGIRNPIFCMSIEEGTFGCHPGTTRLWIAKKHKLDVPCIIADYVDRWIELDQLKSKQDILSKFLDKPEVIVLGHDEMRIDKCPHHHLK